MARPMLALLAFCVLCGSAGAAPRVWARHVSNSWCPLKPGTTFVYAGEKDDQSGRDIVAVTKRTKAIQGVRCTEVSDRLYLHGRLAERTTDWYAQDARGNVWYFGEATAELDKAGKVTSREGNWRAEVVSGAKRQCDVVADGALVFSKQREGRWPEPQEILQALGAGSSA